MSDEADYGNPIAYLVLEPGTPVVDDEGVAVGVVKKVLAVASKDVFDGIVIASGTKSHFIDADQVGRLYEHRAELTISAEQVAAAPEHEMGTEVYEAGVEDRKFGNDKAGWRADDE